MVDEFAAEALHVHGTAVQVPDGVQGAGAVLLQDLAGQREEVLTPGQANDFVDHGFVNALPVAHALVQNGQGVPQGAVRQAGNESGGAVRQFQLFLLRHILDARGNVFRVNAPEVKPLAAGQDGGRKLVDFGGGQDEFDVLRRLFQGLQQRVERTGGEHVDFVNNVDAVFAADRREVRLVPDVPDVVDTVVGRRVNFHHVQDAAAVNAAAGVAFIAGVPVHRVLTVDGLGEDLGAGRLAGSAGAGEQIGVRMPPGLHLIHKGPGNVILSDHIRKHLRPVFPVQRLIHGGIHLLGRMKKKRSCFCLTIWRAGGLWRTVQTA